MLSSVLNSPRAIHVNIGIMWAFVKLRQMLSSNEELARRLDEVEKKHEIRNKSKILIMVYSLINTTTK